MSSNSFAHCNDFVSIHSAAPWCSETTLKCGSKRRPSDNTSSLVGESSARPTASSRGRSPLPFQNPRPSSTLSIPAVPSQLDGKLSPQPAQFSSIQVSRSPAVDNFSSTSQHERRTIPDERDQPEHCRAGQGRAFYQKRHGKPTGTGACPQAPWPDRSRSSSKRQ